MSKPKVFVTRIIAREALDRIAAVSEMEVWQDELPPPYETVTEKARHSDGLLTLLTDRIDAPLLKASPKLKVVSNLAVGFDNIDIAEATKSRVMVGNTPDVLTEATADLAFALLMAAARRVVEGDRYTRAGWWKTWGPAVLLGQDIHGATLGVVGMGRIGKAVAKRAAGFGMTVLYHDTVKLSVEEEKKLGVEYVPGLARLLPRVDFLSLHVPLSTETRYMIGAKELARMKPTAVLVNTSRGAVVDQKALYEALKSGAIFAAGIDVCETEPISRDDPLLTLENVIITPHIASGSLATRTRMALMAADNLMAGLRGEKPPHWVNPW